VSDATGLPSCVVPTAAWDLDHLAIALPDATPFWARFAGDLAGRWVAGGPEIGFWSAQVRFANGMKVEALEPHDTERNDFLVRFLERSGPGPHHLTYKVPDIEEAIERARAAGIDPVGINLSEPTWKEAFLHPKASHGVVVQLAQAAREWSTPPPAFLPPPGLPQPATLLHVAHAVADLEAALTLFKGLLGGTTIDAGAGGGLGWVDLAWPGPGRVRLLSGDAVTPWLGGRTGRVHHVAFAVPDPAALPGVVGSEECYLAAPTSPIGTRLVFVADGDPAPPLPLDPV
jgi:catechol 2,3-dioxygenase-like lactoylglutathione lyase family enzyme